MLTQLGLSGKYLQLHAWRKDMSHVQNVHGTAQLGILKPIPSILIDDESSRVMM
jgi:hypothetical protein